MFPWNIAKSAEAMFSRWAIKRVCKFVLKKKLGQFILGDIDLEHLDVQLTKGTIHLSDLALNVDFINQKFGADAAVYVKEGSIGSLLVTMPWKGKGCEVEVDELELVLAPSSRLDLQFGSDSSTSEPDGNHSNRHGIGTLEHDKAESSVLSASVNVHEGVKIIAKMVKWLLTSFHVKVRKLIVAFDSVLLEHERSMELYRTLVLRITEVECGTCISEECTSDEKADSSNFFGLNRLTNFVKFEGAMLEFLHMNGEEGDTLFSCSQGTTFKELFYACCPSRARTPVLSGEKAGVSGTLKLSIPWKNGSLDIRKVEADAYIDPLELKLQPSSLKWFLCLWDIVNNVDKNGKADADNITPGSVYFNSTSRFSSSLLSSLTPSNDKAPLQNESFSGSWSPLGREVVSDTLLPESRLISDWVPFVSNSKTQNDGIVEEPDFGASVEQFFECFDELRNSQSALANSGMWNWTCSVFSAITAASSLASGSLEVPCEQQHVETNLKATMAGISICFSLSDGDQHNSSPQKDNMDSSAHYLSSSFQDISLALQVSPRERNFKATVQSIDLNDCFSLGDDKRKSGLHYHSDVEGQMHIIQRIQASVESVLPPFSTSVNDVCLKKPNGRPNCRCIYRDDVVKVGLFRTSGATQFQHTVHPGSSSNNFMGPSTFSLKMPPFAFWVNFRLINMVVGLLEENGNSFGTHDAKDLFVSKDFSSKNSFSSPEEVKSSYPVSPKGRLKGDIFLPTARIILCCPSKNDTDCRNYSSLDHFIALDFSSPSQLSEENSRTTTPVSNASPYKWNSFETSLSLSLNMGNLDIYLVTSASVTDGKLVSGKVLSARSRRGHFSVISLRWQEGSGIDPRMVKKAKILATSEDSKGRSRRVGKGYEYSSVTTAKDVEDTNNRTRKDMILSSSFFLHAYLSPIKVNLNSSQYTVLDSLLQQAVSEFGQSDDVKNSSISQTSFLVECDSAEINIGLKMEESVKGSIEKELPGSWHSFRLQIKKFQLLSASNIGGLCNAKFLWAAHGEGNLWGSISGVSDKDLLLISCGNTAMGRGDVEGSNVLSSKFAGSDIIHFWDSESSHDYMSINIRCGTIVAVGGRLDWFERVSSFFSLSPSETGQTSVDGSKKATSVEVVSCRSSFVFNLVDVGLSYEPYTKMLQTRDLSTVKSHERIDMPYIACLLAASSIKLSSSKAANCTDTEYRVVVQDIGILLCTISGTEKIVDTYSAENLHKAGYIKVARGPRVEAILKIFLENGPTWELECSESHIVLETCHDTTSALIQLGSQFQQLFAPDLEESFVHLQTRWNNVQRAQQNDGMKSYSSDSTSSSSQVDTSVLDDRIKPGIVSLMDEICEDEFQFDRCLDSHSNSSESEYQFPIHETLHVSENIQPIVSEESILELIEGYFLKETTPIPEVSVENQSTSDIPKKESRIVKKVEANNVNNGWYGDNSLTFVDNHVSGVNTQGGKHRLLSDEATLNNRNECGVRGTVKGCVTFNNINICWKMYAGSDWHKFQSTALHSTCPRGRDRTTCLELVFSGTDFKCEIYPEGDVCVSRLSLSIQDLLINDNSREAPWKLILGYYQSKGHPRKSQSKAFKLDLESVRPDPLTPLEEFRLRIAFLPMVLHLHQSQLDFLTSFFGGKAEDPAPSPPQDMNERDVTVKDSSSFRVRSISEEALLPYFQKFDIWPVLIRVDYIPSRVDLAALKGGKYVELINLVPWKGVELKLKPVHAVGVYGWSSVGETILGEWLEDISQNQVHKILRGLAPIRSLVAVGSGAAKLVTLPVESYKKDRRVLKGVQRGITAFLRSISLEAVGLGVHLAAGAHDVLLQAEYIFTSIPPSVPWDECRTKRNVRSNQPENATQGMKQACESISDGLGKTASALVRTPLKKYQRSGAGSALVTAIQATPAAAIAPASATARAVHCALLGMRNSLDPDHKKESIEKYLGATRSREKFTEG